MNTKKMLLTENPKALQYLHSVYGFDFEAPHFIGTIPGRFTHKIVTDMIRANIGPEYTAAILVKPVRKWSHREKLHHVAVGASRFTLPDRRTCKMWKFHIDEFLSVGCFENTRKHETERVYIIAQKPEYLRTPKRGIVVTSDTRYRIDSEHYRGGITKTTDRNGNQYISELMLKTTDGKRETVEFDPWGLHFAFERRSDDINDYIDKSGYILQFRRRELHRRARTLKAQHELERLEKADFSRRLEEATAALESCKAHFVKLAQTGDGTMIYYHAFHFKMLTILYEELNTRHFLSTDDKNQHFDHILEYAKKILKEDI